MREEMIFTSPQDRERAIDRLKLRGARVVSLSDVEAVESFARKAGIKRWYHLDMEYDRQAREVTHATHR